MQQQHIEVKPPSLPERLTGKNRGRFLPEASGFHQIGTHWKLERYFRQIEMRRVERLRHRQSRPFFNFNLLVFQSISELRRKPENVQAGKAKYQFTNSIGFQEQFEWQAAAPTGKHKIFFPACQNSFDKCNRQARQMHSTDSQADTVWNNFRQVIQI